MALFGIDADDPLLLVPPPPPPPPCTAVYGRNGGNPDAAVGKLELVGPPCCGGASEEIGFVLGGWGRCSRRKRVDVGVRKQEICADEKESMRLRYLIPEEREVGTSQPDWYLSTSACMWGGW